MPHGDENDGDGIVHGHDCGSYRKGKGPCSNQTSLGGDTSYA